MHNLRRRFFAAGLLIFLFALIGMSQSSRAQGQQIVFSATGDVPYSSGEVSSFKKQMANHNKYSPSAVFVHVGDILSGGSPCNESQYSSMASMLKGLNAPAYIVPGDNETVDCKSASSGMSYFLKYFKSFEQNFCAPNTARQSGRPENWAFTRDGVLFIGINLVYGSSASKQAADWVKQQLEAQVSQVRAAAIFAHFSPNSGSSFSTPFRKAAAAFGKPVLFVHGHGHAWSTSYPFPEKNIFRVQVNQGGSEDPVQVTVTMNTASPSTAFVLKRKPWSSKTVVNMSPCTNAALASSSALDTLTATANSDSTNSTFASKQSSGTMDETTTLDGRLPDEFVLEQNYPNPFNPNTQIRFGLPQASQVTIKVFTINGAEVRTLTDDYYPAGTHTVTFNAGDLPSGTYIYMMQAGNVRQVRRLMLVK